MEKPEFELVFQGMKDFVSAADVCEAVNTRCGLTIIEMEETLQPGATIMRSTNQAALKLVYKVLEDAGARSTIVPSPQAQVDSDRFRSFFAKYTSGIASTLAAMDVQEVEALAKDLLDARKHNRQIFIIGNGGSAANASHMANDFAKNRFEDERSFFRIMSLTDNVSWMTATANDFGYDAVFTNQLRNLLQPQDVVIAISSSGNSRNITSAVEYANAKGAVTYGIIGFTGGALSEIAQNLIYIPTKSGQYGYHEDVTSILTHILSVYIYERDRETFGLTTQRM